MMKTGGGGKGGNNPIKTSTQSNNASTGLLEVLSIRDNSDVTAKRRFRVTVPKKLLLYTMVGFCLVPLVFSGWVLFHAFFLKGEWSDHEKELHSKQRVPDLWGSEGGTTNSQEPYVQHPSNTITNTTEEEQLMLVVDNKNNTDTTTERNSNATTNTNTNGETTNTIDEHYGETLTEKVTTAAATDTTSATEKAVTKAAKDEIRKSSAQPNGGTAAKEKEDRSRKPSDVEKEENLAVTKEKTIEKVIPVADTVTKVSDTLEAAEEKEKHGRLLSLRGTR